MKYFTRKNYNRLQLSGMFPFKSKEAIQTFWEELYVSDYKINQVYYEQVIQEAMPEIVGKLSKGECLFCKEGPAEIFVEALQQVEHDWKQIKKEYKAHYGAIKEQLPECVVKLSEEVLREARIASVEMPSQGVLTMGLDTRFTDWTVQGIDAIHLRFTGVKSVKSEGVLHLSSWLYHEVDLYGDQAFEFCVLLDEGELSLVAEAVEIQFQNRFINQD